VKTRRSLLAMLLIAGVLIGISLFVYFNFIERAREYFITEYYPDTALAPMKNDKVSWGFEPKKGFVTLILHRGKPHSTISTAHGWSEILSLEWPSQPPLGKVDLRAAKVKIGFELFDGRMNWGIGERGVQGHIEFHAIDPDRIEASYDITVDAREGGEWALPGFRERVVTFQGRSSFTRRPCPDENQISGYGKLFP
jgi:hypothetical protein